MRSTTRITTFVLALLTVTGIAASTAHADPPLVAEHGRDTCVGLLTQTLRALPPTAILSDTPVSGKYDNYIRDEAGYHPDNYVGWVAPNPDNSAKYMTRYWVRGYRDGAQTLDTIYGAFDSFGWTNDNGTAIAPDGYRLNATRNWRDDITLRCESPQFGWWARGDNVVPRPAPVLTQ
ncbi:hypothetical protein ACWIGW_16480 [Nocardia brasiliensis]